MEDVQENNIYGIKLGGRHKSVANGIKPEIDEKCGKWFETCYSRLQILLHMVRNLKGDK